MFGYIFTEQFKGRLTLRGGDFAQRKIHVSINDGHNRLFSFPVFPQFWLPAQLLKQVFFE